MKHFVVLWLLLIHLISESLANPVAYTSVSCDFTPEQQTSSKIKLKCPEHCDKSQTKGVPDLRRVELNYRICTHPDIGTEPFSLAVGRSNAAVLTATHSRRKRALQLTPMWQSEPEDKSVSEGSTIELYCLVSSVTSSKVYSWLYSADFPSQIGSTLTSAVTGGSISQNTGTLTIESANSNHAGYYQCKVTDDTQDGEHIIYSSMVKVDIENYYLKTATTLQETISLFSAEDIKILNCPSVDSNPPATITWYKDDEIFDSNSGFVVPFEDSMTFSYNSEEYTVKENSLVLMSLTSEDNGVYKCRASNSKTNTNFYIKEYTLRVVATSDSSLTKAKPTVLRESSVEVTEGNTLELYCLGVGHPTDMTYTWEKADTALDTSSDRITVSDHGRKVTITSAVEGDEALYKCECSNTRGTTSSHITVLVNEPTTTADITITEAPKSLYTHDVYQDNPATINIPCSATGAEQVRFLKNGDLLESSTRYTYTPNTGLQFNSYSSEDSGVYQCVAFNDGHWKQKMTFVMITEKVNASASAAVTEFQTTATLSCAVLGYPYPDVTWSFGGKMITNTNSNTSPYVVDEPKNKKHQLVIDNISFTDGGVYTCTATSQTIDNSASSDDYTHSATDTVILTIEKKIEMTMAQSSYTVTVDDTATLECTAYAKPLPSEVKWYVNDTLIDTSSSTFNRHTINLKEQIEYRSFSELVITGLKTEDNGTYKCQASNTVRGVNYTASASTDVLVKYLTVDLSQKIWSIAPGDAVTVTCTGTGSPKPDEVKWFKEGTTTKITSADDGYTVTSTTTSSYNLISTLVIASQQTDQNYVCESTNYLNNVAQFEDDKVIIKTYTPVVASRSVSFVETQVGQAAAITCFCEGVPLPEEMTWTQDGVQVTASDTRGIAHTADYDPKFKLTSVVSFSSPTSGDIGEYKCACDNRYEGKTNNAETTVEFRVVTESAISWDSSNPKAAPFGQPLNLTCSATGLPRPSNVVWSRQTATDSQLVNIGTSNSRFVISNTEVDLQTLKGTLTILSPEYGDDGTYNCYTDNTINSVVYSRNANSTLLIYQNPTVTMNAAEIASDSNSAVEMTCTVSAKPAPTTLEWYFGNNKLTDQPTSVLSSYTRTSSYTLTVTSLTEGKYRCIGSNTYDGKAATGEAHTYVRLYRPIEMTSTSNPGAASTVNEFTSLTLTCSTMGVPQAADVTWTFSRALTSTEEVDDDHTIVNTVDYERSDLNIQTVSEFRVPKVVFTDIGMYKCKTSQTWDSATTDKENSWDIIVNFSAKLRSGGDGSTNVFQDVGSQIALTCLLYGNPAPDDATWQWADTSGTIDGEGGDITITNTKLNDYQKKSVIEFMFTPLYHDRSLQCATQNALSSATEKLAFALQMNPDTMSLHLTGTEKEGETVQLTCLTTFNTGQISWLKDGETITANNRITFAINETYTTKNSVLTIIDIEETADNGVYSCELIQNEQQKFSKSYTLIIGQASTDTGLSTGIIVALIVLVAFIIIVIILIVVVFVHGRKRKERSIFDDRSIPEGYENNTYDDKHLQSVITMPDTTMDNLPKIVEPIVLSNNTFDHDVKEATIMQQATLTAAQRNRKF